MKGEEFSNKTTQRPKDTFSKITALFMVGFVVNYFTLEEFLQSLFLKLMEASTELEVYYHNIKLGYISLMKWIPRLSGV